MPLQPEPTRTSPQWEGQPPGAPLHVSNMHAPPPGAMLTAFSAAATPPRFSEAAIAAANARVARASQVPFPRSHDEPMGEVDTQPISLLSIQQMVQQTIQQSLSALVQPLLDRLSGMEADLRTAHAYIADLTEQVALLRNGPAPSPAPPASLSPQPNLRAFKVSADAHAGLRDRELATALSTQIKDLLGLEVSPEIKVARIMQPPRPMPAAGAAMQVDGMQVDGAQPPPPARPVFAYVEVNADFEAAEIRANRSKLRDSPTPSFAIRDWLTPAELSLHRQLYPAFKAARAAGQRARWSRAQLFVEGREVSPPAAALTA